MTFTPERIAELRRLAEAAPEDSHASSRCICGQCRFARAARIALPDALREIERLQAESITLDEGHAFCSVEAKRLWTITVNYYEDMCDKLQADAQSARAEMRERCALLIENKADEMRRIAENVGGLESAAELTMGEVLDGEVDACEKLAVIVRALPLTEPDHD